MTKTDRDEFRAYCRNATDAQLEGILEKEMEAVRKMPTSIERAMCLTIAEGELECRSRIGRNNTARFP